MLEINGEKREFSNTHTIHSLLVELELNPELVIIEHNSTIPPRTLWKETCLEHGDRIEIVRIIGGG